VLLLSGRLGSELLCILLVRLLTRMSFAFHHRLPEDLSKGLRQLLLIPAYPLFFPG
jgi:hypothetical protein